MPMNAETALKADRLWRNASALEDDGKIVEAIRLYRVAAKLGDSSSQNNLGNLLDDSVKSARKKEAVYWYKRAVASGSPSSAWNLAMHYRNLGKPRWQMHWLRVAAKLGEPDAPKAIRVLTRQLERPRAPR